jgi:hypothetical protein
VFTASAPSLSPLILLCNSPWLQAPLEPCFHLWISLPEPWRTETFVARARDRGVVVNSSEEFMVGRQSAPHAFSWKSEPR